jgi:hypothetical protein
MVLHYQPASGRDWVRRTGQLASSIRIAQLMRVEGVLRCRVALL